MRNLIKENHVEALRILLNRLNIRFTTHTLSSLKSHPYFPNLIAINYVLNQLNVENIALRVSYEQMQHELPKPLLVHIFDHEGMYLVIADADEEKVHFVNEKGALESQPKDDFLKSWSGVAMLVDGKAKVVEEDYNTNRTRDIIGKIKLPFAAANLLLLIAYAIYYTNTISSTFDYLFLFTKIAGIAVSIPLMI